MLSAILTVENMRGASHDVWNTNTDADYHEQAVPQRVTQPQLQGEQLQGKQPQGQR
jgi:hypothetical protein